MPCSLLSAAWSFARFNARGVPPVSLLYQLKTQKDLPSPACLTGLECSITTRTIRVISSVLGPQRASVVSEIVGTCQVSLEGAASRVCTSSSSESIQSKDPRKLFNGIVQHAAALTVSMVWNVATTLHDTGIHLLACMTLIIWPLHATPCSGLLKLRRLLPACLPRLRNDCHSLNKTQAGSLLHECSILKEAVSHVISTHRILAANVRCPFIYAYACLETIFSCSFQALRNLAPKPLLQPTLTILTLLNQTYVFTGWCW